MSNIKVFVLLAMIYCGIVGYFNYIHGDFGFFGVMAVCVGVNLRGLLVPEQRP